ncbi:MAG: YkgJ family cysteine cluster protein [Gammaproteobacteria bacterium]|nr:YkgJ family cysteine cluster protein [Gammaproteobacteria bacterium]
MNDDVKLFDVVEVADQQELPAGTFSSWLGRTRAALAGENGSEVPCGDCTACCRSSYFIHIRPEETETLARIPEELLFAAPGQPEGTVLLGYDEQGCCPMLVDDKCTIYRHRPMTCRSYDCRVFTAAGISADDKALITRHTQRWKFDYAGVRDRRQHLAVQRAAKFLSDHAKSFTGKFPGNPTQLAILAIEVHDVFLRCDDATETQPVVLEVVSAVNELLEQTRD